MTTKYYCSKHSLNMAGLVSRAYGSHKCHCGRTAKFKAVQKDQVEAPLDYVPPNPEQPQKRGKVYTPDPDYWEYRNKDKASAVRATLYMVAFAGLCYSVYLLANIAP